MKPSVLALALLTALTTCGRPLARAPERRRPVVAAPDERLRRATEAAEGAERAVLASEASAARYRRGPFESTGPFGRQRGSRPEPCGAEDRAAGACEPDVYLAQEVLERDARAILDAPVVRSPRRAWPSWDRRTLGPGVRRVSDRLGLDARVLAALRRNGFAVLDRDEGFGSPYEALREIYRSELPLYVTSDAVLHAVFRSHERLLELLEAPLAEHVGVALADAHGALSGAAARWPRETGRDVDLYLTVARSLLAGSPAAPVYEANRAESARLVGLVEASEGLDEIELFGRPRLVDFTAFEPRGPYADDEGRRRWFRGAMWLSRVEFNVLSRDCRSSQPGFAPDATETPREALDALALAELLSRDGARDVVERAEALWSALAGRREDVAPIELTRMRASAGIARLDAPDAFERLARAVGSGFVRAARTHPMPEGVARLPVIATVLGPRVVPDAAMTRSLVHDAVPGRYDLGAADLALALGHAPAERHLSAEFARFPTLREGFARARAVASAPDTGADLYGAWFTAVRSLARAPRGVLPSFMRGDAWDDLRMNSIVAGYGQLRHANVLVAASSYDGAACAIPDAYVDPTPELYDALLEYVRRARALVAREADWLDEGTRDDLTRYFDEAERTYRVLRRVVDDELAGRALTAEQRRFLGSVVEVRPSSDGSPLHTGWYLDLLPGEEPAMKPGAFVADWYASVNTGRVSYVGVSATRLGLFVVDRGGPPRLMVGPVARAYEYAGPLARRANDESISQVPAHELRAPWAASYTVTPVPPPEIELEDAENGTDPPATEGALRDERSIAVRLTARSASRTPGTLFVEYLDEGGRVVARGQAPLGPRAVTFAVRWTPAVLARRAGAVRHGDAGDDDDDDDDDRNDDRSPRVSVCGRRLRAGAWVQVTMHHPTPGEPCSLDDAGGEVHTMREVPGTRAGD